MMVYSCSRYKSMKLGNNAHAESQVLLLIQRLRILRYASEHMSQPADYLGTKMMEDCIEYMATAPDEKLKRKRTPGKTSKAAKAKTQNLLDMDGSDSCDSEEDEMQADVWNVDVDITTKYLLAVKHGYGKINHLQIPFLYFPIYYCMRINDEFQFPCLITRWYNTASSSQAWLCALDTEGSRQSAKLLRGRTAYVDITEDCVDVGGFDIF